MSLTLQKIIKMNKNNIKTLVENLYNTILHYDNDFKFYLIRFNGFNYSYTARELYGEFDNDWFTSTDVKRFILIVEDYLNNNNDEKLNIARAILETLKNEYNN